jgi:hypothetical protein
MPYFKVNEDGNPEEAPVATTTDSHREIFGIPVITEKDEDQFIIMDDEINMYGVGDSIDEAIEDYKDVVEEYFQMLDSKHENLGPRLKEHWHYLRIRASHFRGSE